MRCENKIWLRVTFITCIIYLSCSIEETSGNISKKGLYEGQTVPIFYMYSDYSTNCPLLYQTVNDLSMIAKTTKTKLHSSL